MTMAYNVDTHKAEQIKDEWVSCYIEKNVLIMGVGSHLEIWAQEVFEEKQKSIDMNKIKDLMMEMGF